MTFTPDGRRILTTSHDRTVKIWDAAPLLEPPILATSGDAFLSVAVSPDGGRIAVGDFTGQLRILSIPHGEEVTHSDAHRGRLWALAFHHARTQLASGGADGLVRIWEPSSETPVVTLHAAGAGVQSLAWSPGDNWLATGHGDGTVRVWDLATRQVIRSIDAHDGPVLSVTFNLKGTNLVTAGAEIGVRIWDARTGRHIRDLPTGAHGNVAALSPTGRFVAAGTDEREIWVWDSETGQQLWKAKGHLNQVQALAFLPDERRLVSCGYNNLIMMWDVATGESTLTLRQHDLSVQAVAVSPDGDWFVTASGDKTVRLWDARGRNH